MTPEEEIESAARALYYRDHRDDTAEDPTEPWEELSDDTKRIWIRAVS